MTHRQRKPLPRSFYLRPTLTVARDLLGKYIVRQHRNKLLIGKIVEVEAYIGPDDPASHAYVGMTERNKVMFGEGGHAYVYFTYGMHFCFNVVTEREGYPAAVLIRAVEPIEGIEVMRINRQFARDRRDEWNFTNGPAKFCQAFAIGRRLNGVDLTGSRLFVTSGQRVQPQDVGRSGRVGVNVGTDRKWRFFVRESTFVSKI